jgi:hypothetical protein
MAYHLWPMTWCFHMEDVLIETTTQKSDNYRWEIE